MPTIARELLAEAEATLAAAGVPSPRVDAELLFAHVTGRPRGMLRMAGGVPADQDDAFRRLVADRAARTPLQHLTGTAPFRHLELAVGPGVFVPRPETELVVDEVLAALSANPSKFEAGSAPETWMDRGNATETWMASELGGADPGARAAGRKVAAPPRGAAGRRPIVVDLCTGSGALALALATEVPGSRVVGVELSADALVWARRNAEVHAEQLRSVGSALELVAADATTVADDSNPLSDLRGMVDVVVTNPPYVPDAAVPRDPEVRDHDPALALFGGPDGLDVVRGLVRQAAVLLKPGGLLVIEHADVQGEDAGAHGVPGLLRSATTPSPAQIAAPRDSVNAASARPDAAARPDDAALARDDAAAPPDDAAIPHDGIAAPAPAWRDVKDHRDLAGLPRFTTAIRTGGSA